ncbi:MAG: GDP-L-fucose synthase [Novosphingobium sp.]|uniref:GDP-L-fucose synthase n=1 Tax=Novosphingobium sp. TaxID=1874826 RepID=UPI0022CC7BE8|nr:GDP-L-fucose synthase [Novosphingobium sp.]MCZ8036145.1 GDP-L-fucose synthase [Novosphingobium sp.]
MTSVIAGKRVFVAGHRGMVGSAIVRRLAQIDCKVMTVPRAEVDLRRQDAVEAYFDRERPQIVFLSAATVGGILANDTRPAEFLYDNLAIQNVVIESARRYSVEKLLFLGSSCIYPRHAPQPIQEDALLTGPLEPTNQWYAIAKIAGIKLCQAYRRQYSCDFISAMPTNLYGPGDNFDLMGSHVIPALMRRAHDAKTGAATHLEVWGTGTPRREFLHVDDLADACIYLMDHYSGEEHVNVGTGTDVSIGELAALVCRAVGYPGEIRLDSSKPDGTPRKLMDVGRLTALGWQASTPLPEGLESVYRWFLKRVESGAIRGL